MNEHNHLKDILLELKTQVDSRLYVHETIKDVDYPKMSMIKRGYSDAVIFVNNNFKKSNIQSPYISIADDGEINFYWNNDKILIDLGFFGDGTYSCYAKTKHGKEFFIDDEKLEKFPKQIIENIRAYE